jgi:HD-like signal output (HDOD) protein
MRVLFVDDEQDVLDGLANALRRYRGHWDMVFVRGGQAAVEQMQAQRFDVVVTDVKMPGIGGDELLALVREENPAAARIVLSGQAEKGASHRLLRCAHQYLAKPCSAEIIREAVEKAHGLQLILSSDALRKAVGKVEQLPSPPDVVVEVSRLIDDDKASLDDIARVIERDPSLAAKVIQIVNSAFFGLPRRVADVSGAVRFLGLDLVRDVVLSSCLQESLLAMAREVPGLDRSDLAARQLAVANLARTIMSTRDKRLQDQAFLAGLLHDVGTLVLAIQLPDLLESILREARSRQVPVHVIESEHLEGVTHAEIGAYLLGLWDVPVAVVEAVAHHNAPGRAGLTAPLVAVLYLAQALLTDDQPMDLAYLETAGLVRDLDLWREVAEREKADPP